MGRKPRARTYILAVELQLHLSDFDIEGFTEDKLDIKHIDKHSFNTINDALDILIKDNFDIDVAEIARKIVLDEPKD